MIRSILKFLLPLVFVAAGAGVAYKLVQSKPRAERATVTEAATIVTVHTAVVSDVHVEIEAQGTVTADRVVQISPRVSGLVVEVAADLQPGARLRKGDLLARIDDRDLRFVIDQRVANVVRAGFELDVERGRSEVAGRDWEMLGGAVDTSKLGRSLAHRKPHSEAAKALVEAAKSALEQARLDLTRAILVAPFDCIVRERRVSEGQLVSPATPLAVLVATDRFFVTASIATDKLAYIDLPGVNMPAGEQGSLVEVRHGSDADGAPRYGRVVRLLGDLDPNGRMARVIIAVENPLGAPPADVPSVDAAAAGATTTAFEMPPFEMPLLLGAYVNLRIIGRTQVGAVELPRLALRENDRVWLRDADGRLRFTPVDVIWRQADTVVVRGLQDGDAVVLSRIAAPAPGQKLALATPSTVVPAANAATATDDEAIGAAVPQPDATQPDATPTAPTRREGAHD